MQLNPKQCERDPAEVVFALSKKGPKSPEEKKSADDNKAFKDAFVSAKAT